MKNSYLVLIYFFTTISLGQTTTECIAVDAKMAVIPNNASHSIDAIANYINANFKAETDKIRAVFFWTASNIRYDVPGMHAINVNETVQERIANALQTKKGVCSHYAEVFHALSQKVGIQSYVIEGYTKQYGKVSALAHAWTAAKIDKKWYVFDPTWGAGYVNNQKFYKKLNNYYFKVAPSVLISSHIPFDYLWQFSNYPVTNNEFYQGKTQINTAKKYFDFEKQILVYSRLSEEDQLFESAERIAKNGLKNAMIVARYEGKKQQLAALRYNTNIAKLNAVVNELNQAVTGLNDFIYYRNNKFKPVFSDEVISNMIEIPRAKLANCQNDIDNLGAVGAENASNVASIKKAIAVALAQAEEHALFVKNYLSKSKIVRKTMFSKVSWFGVPLH